VKVEESIKLYVYKDERVGFIRSAEFSAKSTMCIGAYNQLMEYSNTIIGKEIYAAWISKYQPLRESLGLLPSAYSSFKNFYWLYSDLEELVEYLQNEASAKKAIHEFESIDMNHEKALLKWLVKNENTADNLILFLEVHGDIDPIRSENTPYFKVDLLKIKTSDFENIIRFKTLFDQYYWDMLDKYTTFSEKESWKYANDSEMDEKSNSLIYHLSITGVVFGNSEGVN